MRLDVCEHNEKERFHQLAITNFTEKRVLVIVDYHHFPPDPTPEAQTVPKHENESYH
jgi:hypothetical protein